jgi:hypothetical protein
MTRHYFIVARDQTSLCEYLTRQSSWIVDPGATAARLKPTGTPSSGEAAIAATSRSSTLS